MFRFQKILLALTLCCPVLGHSATFVEKMNNVLYGSGVSTIEDYHGVSISLSTDEMFMRVPADDPRIDPLYFYVLDTVVDVIEHYSRDRLLEITAHTDDLWTTVDEKLVSQRYADAVAEYLVSRGVDGRRIVKVLGVGSKQPAGNNRLAGGRELNRRVEILLLPPKDDELIVVPEAAPAPEPEPMYDK